MTTVAILPIETTGGVTTYQAIGRGRIAQGRTAGEALDALTAQLADAKVESLIFSPFARIGSSPRNNRNDCMR